MQQDATSLTPILSPIHKEKTSPQTSASHKHKHFPHNLFHTKTYNNKNDDDDDNSNNKSSGREKETCTSLLRFLYTDSWLTSSHTAPQNNEEVPHIGWIRDSFKSLTPAPIWWESGSAEEAQVASLFAFSWAAPIREMVDQGCNCKGGTEEEEEQKRNAREKRKSGRREKSSCVAFSSLLLLHGRHSLTGITN